MNWPGLVKRLLLSDGRISDLETEIVRAAILEDGIIDRQEFEFLIALKQEAISVTNKFDELLFESLKNVVLRDGVISDDEAKWLRKLILADQQSTRLESRFLKQLKDSAVSYGEEFAELYRECNSLHQQQFLD